MPVTFDYPKNIMPFDFKYYALLNGPGFFDLSIILLSIVLSYGKSIFCKLFTFLF